MTRTLPRTGERVTTLGLGTFLTFDLKPGDSRDALRQVFERYVAAGGRVVDTSPLYSSAEVSVGQFMGEFSGSDEMFLANKVWATGEYLGDESHAEIPCGLISYFAIDPSMRRNAFDGLS